MKQNTKTKFKKLIETMVRRELRKFHSSTRLRESYSKNDLRTLSFDKMDAETVLDDLATTHSYIAISSDNSRTIEKLGLNSGYYFECQVDIDLSNTPYLLTVAGIDKEGEYRDFPDIDVDDLDGTGVWEVTDSEKN